MSVFHPRSKDITLEAALRDLAGSKDPRTRAECAEALGNVTEPGDVRAAVSGLVDALRDDHPDVRAGAAFSLGHLGDVRAVDGLVALLSDDIDLARQAAAIALARIGDEAAFAPLVKALEDGPPDLRFQAATSLVELDAPRALAPLRAAVAREDDGEVLSAIALGLGEIGDASAAPTLRQILDHSRPQTRFDAAYALASFGDDAAVEPLSEFATDKDLAWPAIEGLERTGSPDAIGSLSNAMMARRLKRVVQLRAAQAILAIEPDCPAAAAARRELLLGLKSWRFEVRAVSVDALAHVGGPWANDGLTRLQSSPWGGKLADEIRDAMSRISLRSAD